MRLILITILIISTIFLQFILFNAKSPLSYLGFIEILIATMILYRLVPTSQEPTHTILQLIYREIMSKKENRLHEQYKVRCSILLPVKVKGRKKLKVHYRFPVTRANTTLDITPENEQGVGGLAYKTIQPQKETNIVP